MAATVLGELLSYITIFLIYFSWWVIPILFLIIAKVKWSKFPIDAIVLEKRGDNLIRTNDRIGRNYDSGTGHTTYRLLKMKDTIDVLPFDCVLHYAIKPTNILEYIINKIRPTIGSVFLLKYGSKQYKPVKVMSSNKGLLAQDEKGNFISVKEMLDKDGQTIYTQNLQLFDIRDHLSIIDFQVIDWDDVNTTLNEIENSRLRRIAKWDMLGKLLLPIAIVAMAVILAIVITYLSYDSQMKFCNVPSTAQPTQPVVPSNQTMQIPIITQMAG